MMSIFIGVCVVLILIMSYAGNEIRKFFNQARKVKETKERDADKVFADFLDKRDKSDGDRNRGNRPKKKA